MFNALCITHLWISHACVCIHSLKIPWDSFVKPQDQGIRLIQKLLGYDTFVIIKRIFVFVFSSRIWLLNFSGVCSLLMHIFLVDRGCWCVIGWIVAGWVLGWLGLLELMVCLISTVQPNPLLGGWFVTVQNRRVEKELKSELLLPRVHLGDRTIIWNSNFKSLRIQV